MRCKSCNTILSESESRRTELTGEFIDLCGQCYAVSARAIQNYHIDSSDYDVEFNDGEKSPSYLQ